MTKAPVVCIVQEYVPRYRVPLFQQMRHLSAKEGISLQVVAGSPQGAQALRDDVGPFAPDRAMKQREWQLLGRRFTLRNARELTRDADLVVVEQARRNLDVYLDLVTRPERIAMWGHGHDYVRRTGRIETSLLAKMTLRARWFFGYTPRSVESVVGEGFPRERTTVLWNTSDTLRLRSDLQQVDPQQQANFRRPGEPTGLALFIGAFDRSKRLDFLVCAAEKVAARQPGFRLVLCGDGPERAHLSQLEKRYSWLNVRPPVTGKALATALASADVVAMPGRVGLVAVDALVAAVPLVTTEWPLHAPEYDYLNSTNSVTALDNSSSYADALEQTIYDPGLNARLRDGARKASGNFSIEAMARRFVTGIWNALE